MKKTLLVIVVLFASVACIAAEDLANDTLTVYGKIAPSPVSFLAEQDNTVKVNLMTEALVQPGGNGYLIGSWTFGVENAGSVVGYEVTYDYGVLYSVAVDTEIEYELLVNDGTEGAIESKANGGTTAFDNDTGNFELTHNVYFRLTSNGVADIEAGAPASENYTDTVTLTLSTT